MIDGAKFTHDPNVPGFQDLIEEFSEVVAGRIEHDSFMVGWDKASEEARIEFKKFMKTFQEVIAAR